MNRIYTLLLCCASFWLQAQTNVTFQVDMTGITVAAEGVHIAGSLNGWNTEANQLTDQGNGIYAATIELAPGTDVEYKFLNGNAWGTEETAPLACSVGGNNRIFTVPTEDMTLAAVPFSGCPADNPTQSVTFRVDMSGLTVSANGVHLAGNFQGWNPGGTQMSLTTDDIYEVTVDVFSSISTLQYKFVNGNEWGNEETPGSGCGNASNNRVFVIQGGGDDITVPTEPFGGCENPLQTKTVTFSVDMDGQMISPEGVHVAGDFQGWDPGASEMTNTTGTVYSFTAEIPVTTLSVQYKFVNGNEWGMDEDPPEECQNADNNRFAALPLSTEPTVLPTYLFGSCSVLTSIDDAWTPEVFRVIGGNTLNIQWQVETPGNVMVSVFDVTGRPVFSERLNSFGQLEERTVSNEKLTPGIYFVRLLADGKQAVRKVLIH